MESMKEIVCPGCNFSIPVCICDRDKEESCLKIGGRPYPPSFNPSTPGITRRDGSGGRSPSRPRLLVLVIT